MVDTATETAPSPAPLPDRSVVPPVWSRITNLDVDRGEGSWLITTDGRRYLDYSSGIGVTNTGHAHPRVAAAGTSHHSRRLALPNGCALARSTHAASAVSCTSSQRRAGTLACQAMASRN